MLKEMPYVYAVYREHGFAKAAESLHITQPVVSTMVKRAEEEFHARIFNRATSPVTLTAAGRVYIRAVEQILEIQNETLSLFNSPPSTERQQFRIGASSLLCAYVLPPVVWNFKKTQYDVYASWTEAHSQELLRLLHNDEVDFVLEADDYDATAFESTPWGEEFLVLAVPADDPINTALSSYRYTSEDIRLGVHRRQKNCVSLSEFSQEPFVLLKDENDISIRSTLLCRRAGFEPRVAMKVDQLMTAYNLARERNGATLIPDNVPKYDNDTNRLFFYTIDSPLTKRIIKLYRKRLTPKTPVAEAFWTFVKENYHKNGMIF